MVDDRLAQLARRVAWLDRNRRTVSVTSAIVLGGFLTFYLPSALGDDWPRFHARLIATVLALICWVVVEISLAWCAAVWETEHDRALRGADIPRASIFRRRK
jgi:uncharacterized membrane protein